MTRRVALVFAAALRAAGALQAPRAPKSPRRCQNTRRHVVPAEVWADYLTALEANPLPVKMATATCIIGAGDAAAQAIEGLKTASPLDPGRVARWAFFGFVLQAPWNHAFQNALEAAHGAELFGRRCLGARQGGVPFARRASRTRRRRPSRRRPTRGRRRRP